MLHSAVWFKVAQEGKTGSGSSGQWASTYGFQRNNFTATVTIPENIRPGQYILRHEMYVLIDLPLKFAFFDTSNLLCHHYSMALHTGTKSFCSSFSVSP